MKRALIFGLVMVVGVGIASFAQRLAGSWKTTIGIEPGPPVVLTIDSELIVTYSISGWSFSSDTVLDETGWTEQTFAVQGSLGAFSLGSTIDFDPAAPAFLSWDVTAGLSFGGVIFTGTFGLDPGVTTLDLVGIGMAGLATVTIDMAFGDGLGCNFNFGGIDITVAFPFCCADVVGKISFTCDGFAGASFSVEGIALPGLPWVTLDAVMSFGYVDDDGELFLDKRLEVTPNFDFGVEGCFTLYISSESQGGTFPEDPVLSFGALEIMGIGLFCEIGGVSFTGVSYWGPDTSNNPPPVGYPYDLKPSILKETPYWEAYQIATTDDGCCGPFSFDITVYFLEDGTLLFDIAELDANMSIEISTQFTFSLGIGITMDPPPASITLEFGFLVEW